MSEPPEVQQWLQRARSNLLIASQSHEEGVYFEDLCFEAQQAAEKALKALLIAFGEGYPRVHSFYPLLERLERYLPIPDTIREIVELTDYAVQSRYPGDYYPVTEAEYRRAIELAARALRWVEAQVPGATLPQEDVDEEDNEAGLPAS